MTTNNLGLYIHIPFCRQKCKYCDFLSFPCTSEQVYREYVTALCMEMDSRKEDCEGRIVDSVFIGGGTPSLLEPQDFCFRGTSPFLLLISAAEHDDAVLDYPYQYHDMLTENGTQHLFHVMTKSGHDYKSVISHLYNFLRMIFQPAK